MERVGNIILFSTAIIAGSILFAIGIRYIRHTTSSKIFNKFLLYTTIVLFFLSGALGKKRFADASVTSISHLIYNDILKKDIFIEIQSSYLKILSFRGKNLTQDELSKLKELVENTTEKINKIENLPAGIATYLKSKMQFVFEEAKLKSEGKDFTKEEKINRLIDEIKFTYDFCKSYKTINTGLYVENFSKQILNEVQQIFSLLRKYNINDKLSASNMKRDAYKNLLVSFMASLPVVISDLHKKFSEPEVVPKYGIRPKKEHPQKKDIPVLDIEGKILITQTGFNEQQLKTGMLLYFTSVLDNTEDTDAVIKFKNGMRVKIDKKEIRIGLELEPKFEPINNDELNKLINDLGSDDWAIREKSTEKIIDFGAPAIEPLEEALKNTVDPEKKSRIENILKQIKEMNYDSVIINNFVFQKPNQEGIDEPQEFVKYGVRER